MRGRAGLIVGLALLLLVALAPESAYAQCAMCRRALSDSEAGPLIGALRDGIAFLLMVPIATFGAIAWFAVRGQRRADELATHDKESA